MVHKKMKLRKWGRKDYVLVPYEDKGIKKILVLTPKEFEKGRIRGKSVS